MKINIINGPNINVLDKRKIYGNISLIKIENLCVQTAQKYNIEVEFFHSNHEGEIVEYIQNINSDGVIINAAAYTHTSIAILDALSILEIPIIEVHISNIFAREDFRKHSYISPIAHAIISGMGIYGYQFSIEYLSILLLKSNIFSAISKKTLIN